MRPTPSAPASTGRQARHELLSFLQSSDPELRARGALALARTGEEVAGALEQELQRLEALPGENGDLASAYLRREETKRYFERSLRELRRQYAEEALTPELSQFDAVLELVEDFHLDGDKVTRRRADERGPRR